MFAELGHNIGAEGAKHNPGPWFEIRTKTQFTMAHNTHDPSTSKHQHGGTDIVIKGPMTQYVKRDTQQRESEEAWKILLISTYSGQIHPTH